MAFSQKFLSDLLAFDARSVRAWSLIAGIVFAGLVLTEISTLEDVYLGAHMGTDGNRITLADLAAAKARPEPDIYPLTDKIDPDTNHLRVIGVIHLKDDFLPVSRHVLDAIDGAQTVLLENGHGFFDVLGDYARAKGKTVINIDQKPTRAAILSIAAGLLISSIIVLRLIAWRTSSLWRLAFYVIGFLYASSAIFGNPIETVIGDYFGPGAVHLYSPSWIGEDRTLAMMDAAEQAATTTRTAMIVGEWHAAGLFWYKDHPKVMTYQRILQKTLWWWLPTHSQRSVGSPQSNIQ